jgi:hemerythrin superfamily protein
MAQRNDDITTNDDLAQPTDAIEMLAADHRKVRALFQQYMATGDQDAQGVIAEQIFVALETHAQLEEMVFYPAFEAAADAEGHALVEEARQDHQEIKDRIAELRDGEAEEEFDAKFRELMDNVEAHVQEEEAEMFPQAAEMLAARNEELVEDMQEIKQRLPAL